MSKTNTSHIITLLHLKNAFMDISITKVLKFCGALVVGIKKDHLLLNCGTNRYVLYKNGETSKCIDVKNLKGNYTISPYDVLMFNYDLSEGKSISELYKEVLDTDGKSIERALTEIKEESQKEVLNTFFGIKKIIKSGSGISDLVEGNLYKSVEKNYFGLQLYDVNGKNRVDCVCFNKSKDVRYSVKSPKGFIIYKPENILLKKKLRVIFDPKNLITSKITEIADEPYVFINDYVTVLELDELFTKLVGSDKAILKEITLLIVLDKSGVGMMGYMTLIHYLLNVWVDYVHFNLDKEKNHINTSISWKVGEGLNKKVRTGLSIGLKSAVHRKVFETYYEKILVGSKFSENIDLLLNKTHGIVKNIAYVNKKKDIVNYRITKNALTLLCYGVYMFGLFELENVIIKNKLS